MPNILTIAVAGAALLLLALKLRGPKRPAGTKPLPGPKGLPVIGNLLEIPEKHSWVKFGEYVQEHGPIVQLNILGQSHILLGSEKVVDDLVRARGAIYSSRPKAPAASMLTQDLHLLLMPQSKELRERKALVSSLLSRSVASQYEPYQWLESFRMLRDIVAAPEEYNEIFDHWSTVMGSRMLYGRAMPERNGPQAEIMDITHKIEQTVQPGAYLVDVLPWMQYLPDAIAPWKRYIKGLSRRDEDFYTMMWNFTRQDLENGRDVPSWARLCMEDLEKEKGKHNMTEHESIHLVGALYTAFGTTSHNLKSFILAAVRHPDWWDRIREEMDKVVGGDRLPTLDDVPNLPLMRAFVTEMTRVWPVTPGGVPHVLVKDDFYEGYHLPAGSVVHIVAWACGRNPETYPEPNEFKPERWLESTYPTYKEPLTEFPTLNNTVLFGAGRRQCPGMLVGTRNVYIQAMMLIWACDIRRAKDASGKEIIPPFYDFVHGFNVGPNKFEFELTPRSQERLDKVEAAYAEALAADPMRK